MSYCFCVEAVNSPKEICTKRTKSATAFRHEVPVAVSDSDSQSHLTDSALPPNSATGSDANTSLAEPQHAYTRHVSGLWYPWLVKTYARLLSKLVLNSYTLLKSVCTVGLDFFFPSQDNWIYCLLQARSN
ncbi:hypothetical protein BaRGS_00019838 [Batillaria attramentaria]|uniref:Uncharacterized protein n=1 Tax=Batillaria attramentaria TaxID=370345 RepID=A0ABD0KNZ5_9CAEN